MPKGSPELTNARKQEIAYFLQFLKLCSYDITPL